VRASGAVEGGGLGRRLAAAVAEYPSLVLGPPPAEVGRRLRWQRSGGIPTGEGDSFDGGPPDRSARFLAGASPQHRPGHPGWNQPPPLWLDQRSGVAPLPGGPALPLGLYRGVAARPSVGARGAKRAPPRRAAGAPYSLATCNTGWARDLIISFVRGHHQGKVRPQSRQSRQG
jgi:hypothetical protein